MKILVGYGSRMDSTAEIAERIATRLRAAGHAVETSPCAEAQRPTWLFQGGPCGNGAVAERVPTPRTVRRLAARIGLAPPVTFGGRLDRTLATTRISRWMATGTYAGDFRDWDQIRSWTATFLAEVVSGEPRRRRCPGDDPKATERPAQRRTRLREVRAMTAIQPLDQDRTVRTAIRAADGIALDPRTHGKGRVPGRTTPQFDLDAFSRALERRDTDYQLSCYAPEADIRIVDPDNPPLAPRLVRGSAAIRGWLLHSSAGELDLRVTQQVDGGDRVAFTERWHYQDGIEGQATSTAELQDGLITAQHTILVWGQNWS